MKFCYDVTIDYSTLLPHPSQCNFTIVQKRSKNSPFKLSSCVFNAIDRQMPRKDDSKTHRRTSDETEPMGPGSIRFQKKTLDTDSGNQTSAANCKSIKRRKHSGVAILCLDIKKTFHSLSHNMLLKKLLNRYKIAGNVGKFIHGFLTNREMTVRVEGEYSDTKHCESGVPQGCCSSTPLSSLGIGDFEIIYAEDEDEEMWKVVYADDTILIKPLESQLDEGRMNKNLKVTYDYTERNQLLLHSDKFQLLIAAPSNHQPSDFKLFNNKGKRIPVQQDISAN